MTAALALAPAEAVLEAALGAGWTVTAGPTVVELSEGPAPVLPADILDRAGEMLVVTYAPTSGRPIHATHTAGERRESEAGPAVLEFVLTTLNR